VAVGEKGYKLRFTTKAYKLSYKNHNVKRKLVDKENQQEMHIPVAMFPKG
jgi:hypothetical protein